MAQHVLEPLDRAGRLQSARSPGVVPQTVVTLRDDGVLVRATGESVEAEQLAASSTVLTAGTPVAAIASTSEPGMTLWDVESPVRILQRVRGLKPNGDLHGGRSAFIEVYGCGPGELQLTLLGKQGAPTRIRLEGEVVAERAIPPRACGARPFPPRAGGWLGSLRLRARVGRARRLDTHRVRPLGLTRPRP